MSHEAVGYPSFSPSLSSNPFTECVVTSRTCLLPQDLIRAPIARNEASTACLYFSHACPPFTNHPRCSDEYADIKAVKLLRRGRRLQQVEQVELSRRSIFGELTFDLTELSTGKPRTPITAFLRLGRRAKYLHSALISFLRPSGHGFASNVSFLDAVVLESTYNCVRPNP